MRFFIGFLRGYFGVPNEKVRVHCNLFADHLQRQRAIEEGWLDALALPRERLGKSTVNVYSKYSAKKRRNVYFGPYRLRPSTACSLRRATDP
jgi:hypothetical protein